MVSTSGNTDFGLEFVQIAEEAFERCGQELTTGYDLRTARRSLDLLLIEWSNRGVNLWTVGHYSLELMPGRGIYPLPAGVVDTIEVTSKPLMGAAELSMGRMSARAYMRMPNKQAQGRPTQYWVDRQADTVAPVSAHLAQTVTPQDEDIQLDVPLRAAAPGFAMVGPELVQYGRIDGAWLRACIRDEPRAHAVGVDVAHTRKSTIRVWPVPDSHMEPMTAMVWYLRRTDSVGDGGTHTQDVPDRFLPALIAGLAYQLSMKIAGVPADRSMLLKQEYEEQWALAATEDRDKAPLRLVPARWGR